MATLTAPTPTRKKRRTRVEIEAIEDAQDLADAKQVLSKTDPATWVLLEEARARLHKARP